MIFSIAAIAMITGTVLFGCRRTLELGFADVDVEATDSDADGGDGGRDTGEPDTDTNLDASLLDGSVRIFDGVSID